MVVLVLPVLTSAFCLFLVQPLLAKQVLPWFGGTASIWAVCMVFFQAMLLMGYLYAHALARYLKPRAQAGVHLAVVAASLLALPIGVSDSAASVGGSANPGWQVVAVLLRAVGIPYFVLSSTSPLIQAWYARMKPDGRAYRLFGWSNLSCSLALLSFPFLLEPWMPLSVLSRWWSWSYAIVALLLACAAVKLWRLNPSPAEGMNHSDPAPAALVQIQWLLFSALGSALLLGVTNYLCQNVAPVPFLWTVPLLLYLLTFFACFEMEWYTRGRGMLMAGAALLGMAWAIVYLPPGKLLGPGIPIFCAGVFFTCFYCHGELAVRKPRSAHLTQFYIVMATGGALGSLLVAFGAPMVFTAYSELPVAMSLCATTIVISVYGRALVTDIAAAACAVLVTAPAFAAIRGPDGQIAAGRNFYGSLRVEDTRAAPGSPQLRKMFHGSISHGEQYTDPARSRMPLSYYSHPSGVGVALDRLAGGRRIGIIGLGTGTLAAYGRPGDVIRIYEINPLVVDYARRYFRYLAESLAPVEIRIGDGRLLLAEEKDQGFDVLVVDAFSGDSIPVHLLTREALQLYRRHVKPDGMIAIHVSNMFLDLQPVVRVLAESAGLRSLAIQDEGDASQNRLPTSWALIGNDASLQSLAAAPAKGVIRGSPPRLWTDDFSTLLAAMR